ncbi:MAG: hypothetical protein IJP94_09385, partial [Clostridia bacterium]|nr:hypothetical protein [Clostridia bacterium]
MVVSNSDFTLALRNDGTVWGWGNVGDGQLGNIKVDDDSQTVPYEIEIKIDGKKRPLSGIKHIAVGEAHALAATEDGHVYAWGLNRNGQLGNGTKQSTDNPAYVYTGSGVELQDIKYVAAGNYSSYAINKDGAVYSWGSAHYGQLGNGVYGDEQSIDGNYLNDQVYAQMLTTDISDNSLDRIIKVSASNTHVLALTNKREVYVWGLNGRNSTRLLIDADTYDFDYIPKPKKLALFGFAGAPLDSMPVDIAVGGRSDSTGTAGDEGSGATQYHS